MYRFSEFKLDTDRVELSANGDGVPLEPQVYSLLVYLIENRDRVVSKDELIHAVWNGRIVSDATLNSRINSLRRAVGDSGKIQKVIKTYPRRGFRFVAVLADPEPRGAEQERVNPSQNRPSIAVLPFEYLAENQDYVYLARGIAEEITTALSRLRWLHVVSSTASQIPDPATEPVEANYWVRGSVHVVGSEIRISAQLTNSLTHHHVWAERFSGKIDEIFEIHDRINFAIATHLEPELSRDELDRLKSTNRPESLSAWERYLRALSYLDNLGADTIHHPMDDLTKAIEMDPNFVLPHVRLAWCWAIIAMNNWSRSGSQALGKCTKHARDALKLDAGDARAHCAMAVAEFWHGNQKRVTELSLRAIELDPNLADAYGMYGATQAISGDPDKAIGSLQRALKGSPRDPLRWFWFHSLANANFAKEDYLEAFEWAEKAIEAGPDLPQSHLIKTASLVRSGKLDEAKEAVRVINERAPYYTISRILRSPIWSDDATFERLVESVRAAGLPE